MILVSVAAHALAVPEGVMRPYTLTIPAKHKCQNGSVMGGKGAYLPDFADTRGGRWWRRLGGKRGRWSGLVGLGSDGHRKARAPDVFASQALAKIWARLEHLARTFGGVARLYGSTEAG